MILRIAFLKGGAGLMAAVAARRLIPPHGEGFLDKRSGAAFRVQADGRLVPTGQIIKAGSPSCVIFAG